MVEISFFSLALSASGSVSRAEFADREDHSARRAWHCTLEPQMALSIGMATLRVQLK